MNNKKSKLSVIASFMKGSYHLFAISMIGTLLLSVIELICPQISRFMVNSVIGSDPIDEGSFIGIFASIIGGVDFLKDNLWMIAVVIIVLAILMGICKYISGVAGTAASEKLTETTRNSLFYKIQHVPSSWHSGNSTGDIIQRCTSDVETLKRFLSEQLTSMVSTVFLIVFSLCFLFEINGTLALIAVISIPILFSVSFFFHKNIRGKFKECDENEGVLSSIVQENLTGVRVVRAFGRERSEIDKFSAQNSKYTGTWVALCRILASFWMASDVISCLQVMSMILVGIRLCIDGSISAGDFIAAVSYNSMLTWPVRRLGRMISEMSKASISLDRLAYIMDSESECDIEGAEAADFSGDIVYENVSFSYDGKNDVLKDISFTVKPGTTVGILGGTGSGKSTLVKLLCRMYDVEDGKGKIMVSGKKLSELTAESLRQNIGIVLQEPFLFSRTISENIAISKGGTTEPDEIKHASEIACLDRTVKEFANGYETVVGERGVTLSGGQKQRVAIARILLRGTPVIIFDDSLSAVDAETDALIRHEIKKELSSSTVIIISHRISSLMHADNIIVLDRGSIAETGDHGALLRQNGIYKRIYDLQHTGDLDI